jgi:hypothetical protein
VQDCSTGESQASRQPSCQRENEHLDAVTCCGQLSEPSVLFAVAMRSFFGSAWLIRSAALVVGLVAFGAVLHSTWLAVIFALVVGGIAIQVEYGKKYRQPR